MMDDIVWIECQRLPGASYCHCECAACGKVNEVWYEADIRAHYAPDTIDEDGEIQEGDWICTAHANPVCSYECRQALKNFRVPEGL